MTIGEGNIWVKKEGKKRLPLALFGDAINRIADIILRIVNNENSIILIDEIEMVFITQIKLLFGVFCTD